ncbi:Collagen adhesin precursor [Streptococcus sp. BCA20]|uniref:Cna B-type domain-containing protein n=1 Tax=Streptococcus oralis TaxID=1303 RepID=UPI000F6777B5|nr:Cna B-type domain-containing protein [Streptococcus oralis]RSH96492.1 Collagen adhesin precursor [Streptococcus oralis]RSJ36360.1 Collagen adhesin precursor [Streptococcus sp. BCA20]
MKKKNFKKLLLTVLFPLMLLGVFAKTTQVEAADITNKVVFSDVKILAEDTGNADEIFWHAKGSTYKGVLFNGKFAFPGLAAGDIKEGDYFTIKVPDGLSLKDATLDLIDTSSNKVLGKVVADSVTGVITFTFSKEVEDKQNVKGTFTVASNATTTGTENTVTYNLPGGTQTITFKPYKDEDAVNVEGEIIHKGGWSNGTVNYVAWWMRVNRAAEDLTGKTVIIKDAIDKDGGSLATFIADSFVLKAVTYESTNTSKADLASELETYQVTTDPAAYKADSDHKALLKITNSGFGYELLLPTNTGTKAFHLEYHTTTPADGTKVKNSAGITVDGEARPTWKSWNGTTNTKTVHSTEVLAVKSVGATVSVDLAGKVKIVKYDEGDANVKLKDVEFDIVNKDDKSKKYTIKTDENGVAITPVLSNGTYVVTEVRTKDGYILDKTEREVKMTGEPVILNIPNKRKTVDFTATKKWTKGNAGDYKQVSVGLYVRKESEAETDAKPVTGSYTPTVTENDGVYTYEWKDQLPELDTDGSKLVYSVRELEDGTGIPLAEGATINGASGATYTVKYNTNGKEITNEGPTPVNAQIQAIKKLTGRVMKAGEFEFDLFDDKTGKVVETVTNDVDGNIIFAELTFDKAGTYNYHIVEKKANTTEKGVTYDANPVGVTVTVSADAEGKLSAAVAYENDDKTFENTYAPKKTSAPIEVTKALSGRTLKADEFEFVLKNDADGSEVQKVKNTADGKVTFAPIEYTKAGTYKYTIVETNAGQTIDGVTYDSLEVKVTVEVTDDGEGKLTANVTYPADKEFNNSYGASKIPATLAVKKTLTGRELKADEFEFTLTDQDGNVKETVKNDKDGNVKFSALEFDKAGTFTYKIAEKAGTATGITYDSKTITATVTVADNGKGALEATVTYDDEKAFENTYTPAGATSVTLGAKKVLEGKDLEAGKYSFELKKEDGTVVETVKNAADGTVTFSPISYDESQVGTHKYTISEVAGTETGITYDKTVQEVEVTVVKVSATELKATASKEANDLVFTNKYTPAKTEVPVKKVWKDANNQDGKRPTSITVKLLADGQDTGKTLELTEANGWAGSFTNLDADKGGTPIQYTVVEVTVTGYTSDVTGDAASGFTITNSYSPETVDVKATKNWDDANNQDGKRPTKITINLLADGQKVESKEVQAAADGTWTVEFTKLAKYKDGKEIKYTVTEDAVAEYESTITDFTITNKYAPKAIDYKVTKVWNDANNQDGKRPESVTVQLYKKVGDADPVAVEGKKLTLTAKDKTDANTWVASFTNLPQYEAGKEITYSIKEVDVPAGYEASVTGQVVTNTHNPETVILSGTKVWKDNNNQDGKRTDKVKVQIFKGEGEKAELVQEIEVSEATGWKFESKALPKYENGTEIKYTVKEVAVKEYTSTITPEKDGKYTITNEHTPEKITVKGKKIWDDANNKDGIRPDSITVALLANGKETGKTVTVTKATALSDNEWAFEFTGLDRYANGKPIEYTVKEVGTVNGYTAEEKGMNVTNTHTPEKPTPGKPNEPGKPGPKPQLPNTGEKASNAAVVAGLALMAVTGGLYFVSRKNK